MYVKDTKLLIQSTLCETTRDERELFDTWQFPAQRGGIDPYHNELLEIVEKWIGIYGEVIYKGKPYDLRGIGRSFILKVYNKIYMFFLNLGVKGNMMTVSAINFPYRMSTCVRVACE